MVIDIKYVNLWLTVVLFLLAPEIAEGKSLRKLLSKQRPSLEKWLEWNPIKSGLVSAIIMGMLDLQAPATKGMLELHDPTTKGMLELLAPTTKGMLELQAPTTKGMLEPQAPTAKGMLKLQAPTAKQTLEPQFPVSHCIYNW